MWYPGKKKVIVQPITVKIEFYAAHNLKPLYLQCTEAYFDGQYLNVYGYGKLIAQFPQAVVHYWYKIKDEKHGSEQAK